MIKIEFDAAMCHIITPLPAGVNNTLASELTWIDRNVSYQNSKRSYAVNERVCIYENQSFLSGLIPRVLGLLESMMPNEEIDIKCLYSNVEPIKEEIPDWAYRHQASMVEAALEYQRCTLHGPTASGKTRAAGFLLQQFRHVPCLFIVPTKGLLEKTVTVLEQMLQEPIGVLGNGKKKWERVTVAIINSIASNPHKYAEQLEAVKVVVIDESHRGASASYQVMAMFCKNSAYRIGLSGTPFRSAGDDIVMEGVMGPVVWSIEERQLADLGVIKKPVCLLAEYTHPTRQYPGGMEICVDRQGKKLEVPYYSYSTKNGKPDDKDVKNIGIVENEERNKLVVDLARAFVDNPNRIGGGLILVERLEQGRSIQRLAARQGLEIPFISGETPIQDRLEMIRQADLGRVDMFIASNILNEGEDMRALQLVIIAGGGSNARTIIQQAGRVIRAAHDLEEELSVEKRFALVVDILDNEPYYLRNNSISRMRPLKERYEYGGAPNVVPLPPNVLMSLLREVESDEQFNDPRWIKKLLAKEEKGKGLT